MFNVVQVCYCSWNHEVYGAELTHQSTKLLSANVALCGQNGQKGEEFPNILLQKGNCYHLQVYHPHQDFFCRPSCPPPLQEF